MNRARMNRALVVVLVTGQCKTLLLHVMPLSKTKNRQVLTVAL